MYIQTHTYATHPTYIHTQFQGELESILLESEENIQ